MPKLSNVKEKYVNGYQVDKETEDVIVNYLNTAEEQYKAKLKEITLAHIIEAAQE